MDKYEIESLFIEISTKNDILFLCSELKKESEIKKELKTILKKIFLLNGFKISDKTINKYFTNYINFITFNLKDNTIKSNKNLKYYIENELLLTIENSEYLFKRFFNNNYNKIENFLFIEI